MKRTLQLPLNIEYRSRTKKMALLLLPIMLFIHLHASSYPSQNLLVSALDRQGGQNVKVATGGAALVDKRGGGGGGGGHGGGGGGHAAGGHGEGGGRMAGGGSYDDSTGKGVNGAAAVVPLYAVGAGAHHVNNRRYPHGKNGGTTANIRRPLLASAVLISLFAVLFI